MEVDFTPDLEAKLDRLAAEQRRESARTGSGGTLGEL